MDIYKIIHTSDWHLGKKLFKTDRMQEHSDFLSWLAEYIQNNKINLLLVAGDIFDSPGPSNEALKLFYDFIYKIGKFKNFESVIITGNHDSSSLFDVPKEFFKQHNCFIYSQLDLLSSKNQHYIRFNKQTIGIKLLPYFRNFELVNHLKNNDMNIEEFFNVFFSKWEEDQIDFKILMAHHSFGNYSASGSEHAIHLSGVEVFPLSWVRDHFDYVALGHIHKKQKLNSSPDIIYPGSPIPLRFSEHNAKYVSEFSIDNNGKYSQALVNIPLTTHLIQLNTSADKYKEDLDFLIKKLNTKQKNLRFLLELKIIYDQAQTGIADKVRAMLKGTNIELISYIPIIDGQNHKNISYNEINQLDLTQLFEKYYQYKFDTDNIPRNILKNFKTLLEEVKHEDT